MAGLVWMEMDIYTKSFTLYIYVNSKVEEEEDDDDAGETELGWFLL